MTIRIYISPDLSQHVDYEHADYYGITHPVWEKQCEIREWYTRQVLHQLQQKLEREKVRIYGRALIFSSRANTTLLSELIPE